MCLTLPFRVLMITRYYKLSIGYANICSSVQDHRQKIYKVLEEQKRAVKSTKRNLKAYEEKRF